jgi:hypothetical protein
MALKWQKRKKEKSGHNKSLQHLLSFVFLVMSSSPFLRPSAQYSRNSTTQQKVVPNFVQAGCPNPPHTHSTNMLAPLSKVHLTHLSTPHSPPTHHTYIPPNIHGIGQLQSQALPLQRHSKQGRVVGRVRGEGNTTLQTLNATQSSSYLTTPFVSPNHRTLHCP